jgi:hypothetical protein
MEHTHSMKCAGSPARTMALIATLLASAGAFAALAAGPAATDAAADVAGAVLAPVVDALAGRHGWVLQALTAMASLRAVFKPLMTALEAALGPGAASARLASLDNGVVGRAAAFLLDLAASVKLHLVLPPPSNSVPSADAAQGAAGQ